MRCSNCMTIYRRKMSYSIKSLTGHDIIEDEFPEEMYGKLIRDIIMELEMKKGMSLLAVNWDRKNIVNPPLDMVVEAGDRMVVLVGTSH